MATTKTKTKRFAGEVVQLTCDCELGQAGNRAVVVECDGYGMELCFFDRDPGARKVLTGADYRFLRSC